MDTLDKIMITLMFMMVIVLQFALHPAEAAEHKLYVGAGWMHLSNVDAGLPFNDKYEDNADHLGVTIEYQYVVPDSGYFYTSFGVGVSRVNTKHQSGWDCSNCKLPSSLTAGYKWEIF